MFRRTSSPLDNVKVASPCPADWDAMVGTERVRFCGQCELNVYNLSGMSRREAETLVSGAEGRLCVRFYRRADGTVLTKDCPVGLRALKRRASRVARATLSAALGFLSGFGLNLASSQVELPARRTMGAVAAREPFPPYVPPPPPPVISGSELELTAGQMAMVPVEPVGVTSKRVKARRLRAGR